MIISISSRGDNVMCETYIIGDKFAFSGRVDFSDSIHPTLIWGGSTVSFRFKGKSLSVKLENIRYGLGRFLGVVVDGEEKSIELADGVQTVSLFSELRNRYHDVCIYKKTDGHYIKLLSLVMPQGGNLAEPAPAPQKRIEFYGDSVTAGSAVDLDDFEGKQDPPEAYSGVYDNSWHSYAAITSRMLPAQINNTSQGGIAIFDGTGYFELPNTIGVESCYDKLRYSSSFETSKWDFSRFVPHVIVFAVGNNDDHPDSGCIMRPEYREKWISKYIEIINDVRSHAPKAAVVLALTILMHNPAWDDAMEEIKNRLGGSDSRVYHYVYKRCGKGTPGHPRNKEQQEMASELTEFLNSLPEDVWQD